MYYKKMIKKNLCTIPNRFLLVEKIVISSRFRPTILRRTFFLENIISIISIEFISRIEKKKKIRSTVTQIL